MNKILKILIMAAIITAIILAVYLPLKFTGALDKINSAEDMKELILAGGMYSYLIFFFLQVAQALFIPIPMFFVTIAGALVFGPLPTMLIGIVAQTVGACLGFWAGRKLGRKVVVWIIGEDATKKWVEKLGKGKYVFFLLMLFPFVPDDTLSIVAGLTDMPFRFFLVTNLITRPIGMALMCYFGGGYIIPFEGYWLILWGVLIAAVVVLMVLSFKYQERIERFFSKLFGGKK